MDKPVKPEEEQEKEKEKEKEKEDKKKLAEDYCKMIEAKLRKAERELWMIKNHDHLFDK